MARKVLRFSVRAHAVLPLQEMRELMEAAMGCTFRDGDFHKVPALVSELLGMKISLFEASGTSGVSARQPAGKPNRPERCR